MKKNKILVLIVLFLLLCSIIPVSAFTVDSFIDDPCRSCWDDGLCPKEECESIDSCQFCDTKNCRVSCDIVGGEGTYCSEDRQCNDGLHCSGVGTGVKIGNTIYKACCPIGMEWNTQRQSCRSGGLLGSDIIFDPENGYSPGLGPGYWDSGITIGQPGSPEVCNGIDDDKDGAIDDGVCGPNDSVCKESCYDKEVCTEKWKEISSCDTCGDGFWNICDEEECLLMVGCEFKDNIFFPNECFGSYPVEICEKESICGTNPLCKSSPNPIVINPTFPGEGVYLPPSFPGPPGVYPPGTMIFPKHGDLCWGNGDEFVGIDGKELICRHDDIFDLWCYADEISYDGKCTKLVEGLLCDDWSKKYIGDFECMDGEGWIFDQDIWCYKWNRLENGVCVDNKMGNGERGCEEDYECNSNYCYGIIDDPLKNGKLETYWQILIQDTGSYCCPEGEYYDITSQQCSPSGVPVKEGTDHYCELKNMRGFACGVGEGKCSIRNKKHCIPGSICVEEEDGWFPWQKNTGYGTCEKAELVDCSECTICGVTCPYCEMKNGVCSNKYYLIHDEWSCNQVECCDNSVYNCPKNDELYCSNNALSDIDVCCYDWEIQNPDDKNCMLRDSEIDSDGDGFPNYLEDLYWSHPEESSDTPNVRIDSYGCEGFFETPQNDYEQDLLSNLKNPKGFLASPPRGFEEWAAKGQNDAIYDVVVEVVVLETVEGVVFIVKGLFDAILNPKATKGKIEDFDTGEALDKAIELIKNGDDLFRWVDNTILHKAAINVRKSAYYLSDCDKIIATKAYVNSYRSLIYVGNVADIFLPTKIAKIGKGSKFASKITKTLGVSVKEGTKLWKGLALLGEYGDYEKLILKLVKKGDAQGLKRVGEGMEVIFKHLSTKGDDAGKIFSRFADTHIGSKIMHVEGSNDAKYMMVLLHHELGDNKFNKLFKDMDDDTLRRLMSKVDDLKKGKSDTELLKLLKDEGYFSALKSAASAKKIAENFLSNVEKIRKVRPDVADGLMSMKHIPGSEFLAHSLSKNLNNPFSGSWFEFDLTKKLLDDGEDVAQISKKILNPSDPTKDWTDLDVLLKNGDIIEAKSMWLRNHPSTTDGKKVLQDLLNKYDKFKYHQATQKKGSKVFVYSDIPVNPAMKKQLENMGYIVREAFPAKTFDKKVLDLANSLGKNLDSKYKTELARRAIKFDESLDYPRFIRGMDDPEYVYLGISDTVLLKKYKMMKPTEIILDGLDMSHAPFDDLARHLEGGTDLSQFISTSTDLKTAIIFGNHDPKEIFFVLKIKVREIPNAVDSLKWAQTQTNINLQRLVEDDLELLTYYKKIHPEDIVEVQTFKRGWLSQPKDVLPNDVKFIPEK